jgi:hypothetical protein
MPVILKATKSILLLFFGREVLDYGVLNIECIVSPGE